MYNSQAYVVEELEVEEIVLQSVPRVAPSRRDVNRFKQFIDNVAMAIVNGDIDEITVKEQTTDAVFDAVLVAMQRFEELSHMYSSSSSLGGVSEYLNPESFTFSYSANTKH